jgi:hypothetical protein
MGEEERAGRRMIEFTAIVALNCLYEGVELRAHIREKVSKSVKSVGFEAQRKCPAIMSAIIKYNKIILIARNTNNW